MSDDYGTAMKRLRLNSGREVLVNDPSRTYTVRWVTDRMESAGWYRERPTNWRLALLKQTDGRTYRELASVELPPCIGRGWGRLKQRFTEQP